MQWHQIHSWALERLSSARERNDGNLDAIETAKLRGRIEVLKELVALPETQKILDAQPKFAYPEEDSHGF